MKQMQHDSSNANGNVRIKNGYEEMHKFSFERILNYARNFQFSRLNTWNDDNKNICNWFSCFFSIFIS